MSNLQVLKGVKDEVWIKTEANVRQDHGRTIKVPFEVKCKKPSTEKILEIRQGSAEGTLTDADVARDLVLDWNMPGNDGGQVEFNPENFDLALNEPDYLTAIGNAIAELIFGKEVLRRKNSGSSGAPGRAMR